MHDLPETSESLILRVKDPADGAAWSQFLEIYRPVVYRLARRKGLQDSDAEDLAQRVFLAVSQSIQNWEPGPGRPPFRAWLAKLARNAILNALTRRRPDAGSGQTSVMELLAAHPESDPAAASELLREGRRETFRWAAEQVRPEFSEATWRLFWETTVGGRTVADVSAATGRTAGAVYMARFAVLKRLKAKVQEVSFA